MLTLIACAVNRNLVGFGGVGFLSTDQKKKLLWGNKKNTSTEEVIIPVILNATAIVLVGVCHHASHFIVEYYIQSSSRWDSHLFPDQDRQEKFNRLMVISDLLSSSHVLESS